MSDERTKCGCEEHPWEFVPDAWPEACWCRDHGSDGHQVHQSREGDFYCDQCGQGLTAQGTVTLMTACVASEQVRATRLMQVLTLGDVDVARDGLLGEEVRGACLLGLLDIEPLVQVRPGSGGCAKALVDTALAAAGVASPPVESEADRVRVRVRELQDEAANREARIRELEIALQCYPAGRERGDDCSAERLEWAYRQTGGEPPTDSGPVPASEQRG